MSPSTDQFVALFDVSLDGGRLADDVARQVREIKVASYLRLPDVCTLTAALDSGAGETDRALDSQPFKIGAKLSIKLGSRDALSTTTLFEGEIVTLEPNFAGGGVEIAVRAFDPLHRLLRSRHSQTFQNQTASDVVQQLIENAGLSVQCEASGAVHEFLQQSNETDWDFIWRLADRIGFELVVDNGEVHFRKPKKAAVVGLQWPEDLHAFTPRLTAVQQVSKVTLAAFDPKNRNTLSSTASSADTVAQVGASRDSVLRPFPEASVHVATEPVKTRDEGDALARALLEKLANGYIAAEGVTDGNPAIRAGTAVQIRGLGRDFSGTYRVAAATHVLRGGGTYETHFSNSAAHTLLGAVGGDRGSGQPDVGAHLVVGMVTNNQDPDGSGRIRVTYPALGNTPDGQPVEGWWAPLLVPSAGKSRGLVMLPQPGDEVLVGFEHDDVTRPYVLGSVFNGKTQPGDELMQSQDGSLAVLSDQKIVLQSKSDQQVTSKGKLMVEVEDNVQEKFKRDWTTEVTGQATLKATQPFEIDGQNVTIKGQAQISIEGNAQVTIKCGAASVQLSSAGVQISGPMIQLG